MFIRKFSSLVAMSNFNRFESYVRYHSLVDRLDTKCRTAKLVYDRKSNRCEVVVRYALFTRTWESSKLMSHLHGKSGARLAFRTDLNIQK